MKLTTTIIFAIAVLSTLNLSGQGLFEKETFAFHPKIGMAYNIHSADFRNFEGSADCGLFKSGSGMGLSGGLFFEKLISQNYFAGIGLGFVNRSAKLSIGTSFPSRDLTNNEIVTVKTDNNLDATLSYLEIQPDIRYILSENFIKGPLRFVGALRFYFPLSSNFDQIEEIQSPAGAVFVSPTGVRSRTRDIASGEITSINSFGYGISFGLENMLKIGDRSFFTQQLMFDVNLKDVASDAKWTTYALRLELGLRYSLQKKEEVIKEATPPPPPPIEIIAETPAPKPEFNIKLKPLQIALNSGNELLATVPLVNAVFFPKSQSALPANYSKSDLKNVDLFGGDEVKLHDYVLPRIAAIVKQNPKSSIILESSTSGSANEPEGIELARKRANEVKSAFVALGVDNSKISIVPKVSPQFQSNQDFPEGVEENQRVDIIVKNAPLQEYVDIQKYREIAGNIHVNVEYENYPAGTKAKLTSNVGTKEVIVTGRGDYSIPVKVRIDEGVQNQKFEVKFKIEDEEQVERADLSFEMLPLVMVELNLDNFEAILRFDYNSSVLSDDNKGLLRQLAEKLPQGATIQILGSADALGTEERNIVLSKERASNTEQFIKSVAGSKFTIETGISNNKFNESTPQGRFLNRSIRIKVMK